MARFAVLLRGLNVGRARRVSMADLHAVLGRLGCTDVATHLQSGNAVVTAEPAEPAGHAARIETALAADLGLDARCIVLTAEHLHAVVAGHPFPEVATHGSRMMAYFLAAAPDPALLAAHDPVALDPGHARLGDRVIYHWCPDGLTSAPQVSEFAEKHLRVVVTARNWNTVTSLDTLLRV